METTYSPSKAIQVQEVDMRYFDRGVVSDPDFIITDLIIDNAFHDLDLSAIVPEAAANHLVHLAVFERATITTPEETYRLILEHKEIVGKNENKFAVELQVSGEFLFASDSVMLDTNRMIKYKISGTPTDWTEISITVRGWWTD